MIHEEHLAIDERGS